MKITPKHVLLAAVCLAASLTQAQPLPPEQLQLRVKIEFAADMGISGNSMFNPRYFDGNIYANQINVFGFGRYPSGSPVPSLLVTNDPPREHRMVAPFRGALSTTYILASSQGFTPSNTTFSCYSYYGTNRVDADVPDLQTAEGFDWVDDDTIIYTVYYLSGNRKRLCLADVVAEPFAVTKNTTWNANGYITTSVSTRIRNVRVGDVYSGYAYYGDGNQNNNPNFYAVNLATGAETLLGNAGTLTGTGSFGVWTVLERGGYLYVQTTDNGIQVYSMTGPTTLGSLYTTYDRATLDTITSYYGQCWGLDVTRDGKQLVLSATGGVLYELGSPILSIARSGTDAVLSWPASVVNVVVQSATSLSPSGFSDVYPSIAVDGKFNTTTNPIGSGSEFFRLRRSW